MSIPKYEDFVINDKKCDQDNVAVLEEATPVEDDAEDKAEILSFRRTNIFLGCRGICSLTNGSELEEDVIVSEFTDAGDDNVRLF